MYDKEFEDLFGDVYIVEEPKGECKHMEVSKQTTYVREPLNREYMQCNKSDRLYNYLHLNSAPVFVNGKEYRVIRKDRVLISTIANDINRSRKTVAKTFDALRDMGFIKEYENDNSYWDLEYDRDIHSVLLLSETIEFLLDGACDDAIKVYSYLYFRFQKYDTYEFTKKQLAVLLGYKIQQNRSLSQSVNNKISAILTLLEGVGLITKTNSFKNIVKPDGTVVQSPIMILTNVNSIVSKYSENKEH